jgi:hypothetical protein
MVQKSKNETRNRLGWLRVAAFAVATLFLGVFSPAVSAQKCPAPDNAQYPSPPLTYPMPSDQYAVAYSVNGGAWTPAPVYISIYGGSNSSPYEPFTNYLPFANDPSLPGANNPSLPTTSMSFVSIPAQAKALVRLRVTKLGNGPFLASDQVSVRPAAKAIPAYLLGDGSVLISRVTQRDFAGDQFVLWWDRDSQDGGAVQGLAFFLDPPYDPPTGNVAYINSQTDFSTLNLKAYDAVEFDGTVAIQPTPHDSGPEGPGAQVLLIPPNVSTVFLAPGSWVQGKIQFDDGDTTFPGGQTKRIYGPGVLDSSRFTYVFRQCRNATGNITSGTFTGNFIDGLATISWIGNPVVADTPEMDGIILTDADYNATGNIPNGVVNNVKVIGWNANNDGLQMGDGTRASNVFIRTGDDSLEVWGSSIKVANATVWQNDNGGVVNLGWLNKFQGDDNLIDGLYVVRTDWPDPAEDPIWFADDKDTLAHQNNAIIVSLMVPGTSYGQKQPPVYRTIFLDDTPRVLFSLKILPVDCDLAGIKGGVTGCPQVDLKQSSLVALNIENVFAPQSTLMNSIGFQTLPEGFTQNGVTFGSQFTLRGTMNIGLTNVFIKPENKSWDLLTSANAAMLGPVCTNGEDIGPVGKVCANASNVNIQYNFDPFALLLAFLTAARQ